MKTPFHKFVSDTNKIFHYNRFYDERKLIEAIQSSLASCEILNRQIINEEAKSIMKTINASVIHSYIIWKHMK